MGDFLRTHWLKFVIGGAIGLGIGVILIIVGIYYVATGENSTVKAEFEERIPLYNKWARDELRATTFSVTSPTMAGSVSATTTVNTIRWDDGTTSSFNQTFLFRMLNFAALETLANANSGDFAVSTSLSYTPTTSGSTRQTSTVTTAEFPLVNGSGYFIEGVCVVIKREYANSEWLIDSDKKACQYPFDAKSNDYQATKPTSIPLVMVSQFDPILVAQYYLEDTKPNADGTTPNKKLYLVDPNTPTVFGLGAFLFVAGIVVMITFGCFCRPKPLDGDPQAQQPGQVQQGVPVQQGYGKSAV